MNEEWARRQSTGDQLVKAGCAAMGAFWSLIAILVIAFLVYAVIF